MDPYRLPPLSRLWRSSLMIELKSLKYHLKRSVRVPTALGMMFLFLWKSHQVENPSKSDPERPNPVLLKYPLQLEIVVRKARHSNIGLKPLRKPAYNLMPLRSEGYPPSPGGYGISPLETPSNFVRACGGPNYPLLTVF